MVMVMEFGMWVAGACRVEILKLEMAAQLPGRAPSGGAATNEGRTRWQAQPNRAREFWAGQWEQMHRQRAGHNRCADGTRERAATMPTSACAHSSPGPASAASSCICSVPQISIA